jgi:acyl carrier protein
LNRLLVMCVSAALLLGAGGCKAKKSVTPPRGRPHPGVPFDADATDDLSLVRRVVAQVLHLKPDQIDPEKTIADHGGIELDLNEIISHLEERLRIEPSDRQIDHIREKVPGKKETTVRIDKLAQLVTDCRALKELKDTQNAAKKARSKGDASTPD